MQGPTFREGWAAVSNDSDLLDIRGAAALLGVSATSLRRWTKAGRLPCFRLGGRRERRFRRADLLAFLESGGSAAPGHEASPHLCGLYSSPAVRDGEAAAFLAAGLEAGSACVLVAAPRVRERMLARLDHEGLAPRQAVKAGQLVLSEYAPAVAQQIKFWDAQFTRAQRVGAKSLRAVGDLSGEQIERHGFDGVMDYERQYDDAIAHRFPVTTLCLYDARTLSGVDASRLLGLHGDMFRYPVETLVS